MGGSRPKSLMPGVWPPNSEAPPAAAAGAAARAGARRGAARLLRRGALVVRFLPPPRRAAFFVLRALPLREARPALRLPAFFLRLALRFFAISSPLVAPYPYRNPAAFQHRAHGKASFKYRNHGLRGENFLQQRGSQVISVEILRELRV